MPDLVAGPHVEEPSYPFVAAGNERFDAETDDDGFDSLRVFEGSGKVAGDPRRIDHGEVDVGEDERCLALDMCEAIIDGVQIVA